MSNFTDYYPTADLMIGIVGTLLASCTIVANTLVIAIISRFEKRTNSELIFLNIALTDVVGGIDAIFAFGILLIRRRFFDFYFIDEAVCQVLAATWRVTSVVTPLMLSLTSLGRFLAVVIPHRYEGMFSKQYVILCLGVFWTISTLGGTIHLYKLASPRMEPAWGYCDYRLSEIYTPMQTRVIVATLYAIPLAFSTIMLVFCNAAICVKLLQMRVDAQRRINKKISVANGLGAALHTNIAVADTSAARRYEALRARVARANASPNLAAVTRKIFAKSTRCRDNGVLLGYRITATDAPPKGLNNNNLINTNVFELNVVLMDPLMQCGLALESMECTSGPTTPGSSVPGSPRSLRGPSPRLSPRHSPNLLHETGTSQCSSPLAGRPGPCVKLSPAPVTKADKRRIRYKVCKKSASISSRTSLVARFRRSFFSLGSTASLEIAGKQSPDSVKSSPAPQKLIIKKRKSRGRRELSIVMVTSFFTLNFVSWNCILLFYYFANLVSPSNQVFSYISGDNKILTTYLNGWFYYATFLTSSINPVIHFVCNKKIRAGYRQIHDKIVGGIFTRFAVCNSR